MDSSLSVTLGLLPLRTIAIVKTTYALPLYYALAKNYMYCLFS
jgi:hypothetical protein